MQEADSNAPKEIVEPRLRRPLFRRLVRWSLAALLFPVGLLILVSVALYIPAVQDLVRGKAVAFLHEKLGAEVALEKLASGGSEDKAFYGAKLVTARYFGERFTPDATSLRTKLSAGCEAMMALPAEAFARG